ncbi:hypothetical protein EXIGLDRAFT_690899 [Exidia glandulosa HHB12029]|uniref:F-box domain-containing protein n=1 Tax=Exidia glandulosa HHB12029 TaxID=1314781 RepID=A0A166BV76_EXIGL|nr:hypothetical protein EXIGLDRAFT_690899 [Exidia glandulosa HHB12029]
MEPAYLTSLPIELFDEVVSNLTFRQAVGLLAACRWTANRLKSHRVYWGDLGDADCPADVLVARLSSVPAATRSVSLRLPTVTCPAVAAMLQQAVIACLSAVVELDVGDFDWPSQVALLTSYPAASLYRLCLPRLKDTVDIGHLSPRLVHLELTGELRLPPDCVIGSVRHLVLNQPGSELLATCAATFPGADDVTVRGMSLATEEYSMTAREVASQLPSPRLSVGTDPLDVCKLWLDVELFLLTLSMQHAAVVLFVFRAQTTVLNLEGVSDRQNMEGFTDWLEVVSDTRPLLLSDGAVGHFRGGGRYEIVNGKCMGNEVA